MTEPGLEVSPVPWPMVVVLSMGAFSALAWGFATLLRPRGRPVRPDEEDDRRPDDATLEEPRPEDR